MVLNKWPIVVVPNWCNYPGAEQSIIGCSSLICGCLSGTIIGGKPSKKGSEYCEKCDEFNKWYQHDSDHEVDIITDQQIRKEIYETLFDSN